MGDDQLTPETMQLNEFAPSDFCAEPRILSQEVWELRREVAAMRKAVLMLTEKLDAVAKQKHPALRTE